MRDDQHRFLMLLGQLPARLTAEQTAWLKAQEAKQSAELTETKQKLEATAAELEDAKSKLESAGDAGMVGDAEQRDAGLVAGVRDGGDQGAFHRLLFSDDERAGRFRK